MHVVVGMSGGVDSSVTAYLLQQQGHQVTGLFMKNWDEDDGTEYCTAIEDLADAQAVADKLGIELKTVNFAAEYWDEVFEHFIEEYQAGRTPNPDILCNREIKFKAFLDYARTLGAEAIATGHYVRRTEQGHLLRGLDGNKDQSYFLHALSTAQVSSSLFPVGELEKPEVRSIAEEQGFVTARKKDSTGICFIGERRFSDFLKRYVHSAPGDIVTPEGDRVGQHQGLSFYTLGQRQGLGIGGLRNYPDEPWFVADKDMQNNQLIAVQGAQHPLLMSKHLWVRDMNWIGEAPTDTFRCSIKVRYRSPDVPCSLAPHEGGWRVTFDQPEWAVTPGQSAVLYDGERCLGGGVIESFER
jgi:tRNA-uridine 2-sulfurtransferase